MHVSIVLYVHNGGSYLPPALESILQQTHQDFELCVVDDGSTDETPHVLFDAMASDDRIRVVQQGWLGSDRLHDTFNNALAMTRHDLIAIANADDIWLTQKIERQIAAFAADPELDICHHDATFIDHAGRVAHGSFRNVPSRNPSPTPRPWQFIGGNPIPNPTVMFHRSILRRIGLQEVGQMHDYQFWFKAAVHGCRFVGLPDRLIRYRVHEGSESTATAKKERIVALHRACALQMVARHGLDDLYPELDASGNDADSRAWAWSHVGAMFWKGEGTDAAATAWEEALRISDNPAILCNLGAAALCRDDRHRGLQLLTCAGQAGYERARLLASQPELAGVLAPEIWAGPQPPVAEFIERSTDAAPDAAPRVQPVDVCIIIQPEAAHAATVSMTLHDVVVERGGAPTSVAVIATSDAAVAAVVQGYEQLEQAAPGAPAALDIEVLRAHPDEAASVAAAHLLDGATTVTLDAESATEPLATVS